MSRCPHSVQIKKALAGNLQKQKGNQEKTLGRAQGDKEKEKTVLSSRSKAIKKTRESK